MNDLLNAINKMSDIAESKYNVYIINSYLDNAVIYRMDGSITVQNEKEEFDKIQECIISTMLRYGINMSALNHLGYRPWCVTEKRIKEIKPNSDIIDFYPSQCKYLYLSATLNFKAPGYLDNSESVQCLKPAYVVDFEKGICTWGTEIWCKVLVYDTGEDWTERFISGEFTNNATLVVNRLTIKPLIEDFDWSEPEEQQRALDKSNTFLNRISEIIMGIKNGKFTLDYTVDLSSSGDYDCFDVTKFEEKLRYIILLKMWLLVNGNPDIMNNWIKYKDYYVVYDKPNSEAEVYSLREIVKYFNNNGLRELTFDDRQLVESIIKTLYESDKQLFEGVRVYGEVEEKELWTGSVYSSIRSNM